MENADFSSKSRREGEKNVRFLTQSARVDAALVKDQGSLLPTAVLNHCNMYRNILHLI